MLLSVHLCVRFRMECELNIPPSIGPRYCSVEPDKGIREKFQKKSGFKVSLYCSLKATNIL